MPSHPEFISKGQIIWFNRRVINVDDTVNDGWKCISHFFYGISLSLSLSFKLSLSLARHTPHPSKDLKRPAPTIDPYLQRQHSSAFQQIDPFRLERYSYESVAISIRVLPPSISTLTSQRRHFLVSFPHVLSQVV